MAKQVTLLDFFSGLWHETEARLFVRLSMYHISHRNDAKDSALASFSFAPHIKYTKFARMD